MTGPAARAAAATVREQGYAVLPGLYTPDECRSLRARMAEMVAAFDPTGVATVFSTTARSHAQDDYFLSSGDTIRFFFEDGAFADDGTLTCPKELALNKVGHAMHDLDPVFSDFSRRPELAALADALGLAEPLLLQSMYIFKQPRIGGEVIWHTDHTFLWTEPRSVVGFWVALEDATVENGCLWAIPGGHRIPVKSRFRRAGAGTVTDVFDDTPYDDIGRVPLEAETGTLVVLDGALPHWSAPNRSDRSRHAYTLHVIDGACDYPADNWLRRGPDLPLRGFEP